MSLTNAIAIIRRQDAKVKVEVPAAQGRKAYSYMREGSDNPSTPKSANRKKMIGGAIAGVVGVGALTAGVLALRRAKKGGEDEPKKIAGDDAIDAESREVSNAVEGSPTKGAIAPNSAIDVESREVSNAVKGTSSKGAIAEGQPTQRKKPIVTPPPSGSGRVLVTPPPKSIKETVKKMADEGVTATPSKQNAVLTETKAKTPKAKAEPLQIIGKGESPVSRTRSNFVSKQNAVLVTKEGSTAPITEKKKNVLSRGIDAIKKMTKEGVDRDRKAGGAFAEREIDLNKTAYSAGEKSRIAAQNLATFAKAYNETFGKKQPKAIDVEATEVKETLQEGKPMKKAPKPKVPKQKPPTAAEKKAIQKKLNDLNKGS